MQKFSDGISFDQYSMKPALKGYSVLGSGVGRSDRSQTPTIKPIRPNPKKIALAVAPIMRGVDSKRVRSLDVIARLAGEKPEHWTKPSFGEFEYFLAHQCGWIGDDELQADTDAFRARQQRARETSQRFKNQRFTWEEGARYEEPPENGEYVPEISMKLIKDRNLTDSSRRVALFLIQQAYMKNRAGRYVGITVSYIMKGLSISRRTVQRSLTLLETRGYFRCEVSKGIRSRMCIGLIVHLLKPLFPKHHQEKWPLRRRNPEASAVPQKYSNYSDLICSVGRRKRVSRFLWAVRCLDGVARSSAKCFPSAKQIPETICRSEAKPAGVGGRDQYPKQIR